jgi:6-phosphogluconate dehydrogenase
MELGMIGLGRMGLNMTIRLLRGGHRIVVTDRSQAPIQEAERNGAIGCALLEDLIAALKPPRALWMMIPAGHAIDVVIAQLDHKLDRGDVLVDGGNSSYKDSRRRHEALAAKGIHFVDAGTSGGIWGLENGYCLMVGGDGDAVKLLAPALDTLAPPQGWRHVGLSGAGHFAKMIHNGVEYGMMQSYAEGFELLRAADYSYDLAELAALWNRGSVVRSWLLELAERALRKDPGLEQIRGWVEDSGEGRWTVQEAIDRAVPAPVLALSLMARFRSRQSDSFRDKLLAALRAEFGGHAVKDRQP